MNENIQRTLTIKTKEEGKDYKTFVMKEIDCEMTIDELKNIIKEIHKIPKDKKYQLHISKEDFNKNEIKKEQSKLKDILQDTNETLYTYVDIKKTLVERLTPAVIKTTNVIRSIFDSTTIFLFTIWLVFLNTFAQKIGRAHV